MYWTLQLTSLLEDCEEVHLTDVVTVRVAGLRVVLPRSVHGDPLPERRQIHHCEIGFPNKK